MRPYKTLCVPVSKGIYRIYLTGNGIRERIIVWNPGTVSTVILGVEAQHFPFINIFVLCIVGSESIVELAGALVANSIIQVIFTITLRDRTYFKSPRIMVVAAHQSINDNC